MLTLFKIELKRFGKYIFLLAFAQIVLWAYVQQQTSIMNIAGSINSNLSIYAILASLLFAITQFAMHKRKNHWTYLVHRPLPIAHIFIAIAGAGVTCIILALSLPLLLSYVTLSVLGNETVELRHYLYVVHITLIALTAYLIGAFAVLNASWGAILLVTVFTAMLTTKPNSVTLILLSDLAYMLIAFYLAISSFQVNLSKHFTKKRQIIVAAVFMQPIAAMLLMMTQLTYHLPLMVTSSHPDRYDYSNGDYDNYYSALWHWDEQNLIEKVVDETIYPDKQLLLNQIDYAEQYRVRMKIVPDQVNGQLPHQDKTKGLFDNTNKVFWQFSHNQSLYIGRDKYSKDVIGYMGKKGFFASLSEALQTEGNVFDSVPIALYGNFIQTKKALYIVDFVGQYVELKNLLSDSEEHFIRPLVLDRTIDTALLVTNKGLHFFSSQLIQEENTYTESDLMVPYQQDLYIKDDILIYRLVDGYLLRFASRSFYGFEKPGVSLVHASYDGTVVTLGEKAFDYYRPLPLFISDQDFWQSPIVVNVVFDTLSSIYELSQPNKYTTFWNFSERTYSSITYYYAIVAAIMSALLCLLIARRIKLGKSLTIFWVVFCLIASVPGLFSFLLLNPWRHSIFKRKRKTTEAKAQEHLSIA